MLSDPKNAETKKTEDEINKFRERQKKKNAFRALAQLIIPNIYLCSKKRKKTKTPQIQTSDNEEEEEECKTSKPEAQKEPQKPVKKRLVIFSSIEKLI